MSIHPTAVISKDVELAPDVEVGPFTVISGKVKIGSGTKILNNVSIGSDVGIVEIGKNNVIYPYGSIGGAPQDLKYKGEATKLTIGDNNTIREGVTFNLGTITGRAETTIGNNNLIMAYVHIGHDCIIHNHTAIANSANIAGHVEIFDHVKIGGMVGITQFCRLGTHAFVAGVSGINKDLLPYSMAQGTWAIMRGTNKIGMERAGFSKEEILNANKAMRIILKAGLSKEDAIAKIKEECADLSTVREMLNFYQADGRGLAI